MTDPYDREVAAVLPDGAEIVRYDKAGHWYIEWPPALGTKRRKLKIGEAARLAIESDARIRQNGPFRFPAALANARKTIAAEKTQ